METMSEGWLQFLFVAVPVLSLIGSWMALRTAGRLAERRREIQDSYGKVDKAKAARLVECLKRYRRGVPASTGEPGRPVHDEWSHGADAFRYLAINADGLTNESWGAVTVKYPNLRTA